MLPASPVMASDEFGYLLEHPSIPHYSLAQASSENVLGADNQQERPGVIFTWNPQRLYAKRLTRFTRETMI